MVTMVNLGKTLTVCLLTAYTLMFISIPMALSIELEYSVDSVEATVYRDGLVHVTEALTVNETVPAITLELLAQLIENIIVVDENDTVLDYEVEGLNITVFTLGATRAILGYDTDSLTGKEAGVWTLILDNPYNLTVYLPAESTIIYLNEIPTSIDTMDGKIALSLFPGEWEISYVLPIVPPPAFTVSGLVVSPTEVEVGEEVTISATVTNTGEGEGSYTVVLKINEVAEDDETVLLAGGASTTVEFQVTKEDAGTYSVEVGGLDSTFTVKEAPSPVFPIPIEYIFGAVALVIVGGGGGFIMLKRRAPSFEKILKEHPELRQEDREVIQFIAERGGKVLEAEIRERFPDLPRTTAWRLIRRLEKMEIVAVKKIGLQNQIELKK
ncbi:MAG: hypothetical protein NWE76_09380 [Candidatus Bathyarchaeota archaeon]|nr:hypothetical protein [Candidatus Bathyarchaeota archaeon]